MNQAAIYSRVDPKDRTVMPADKAAAEAFCAENDWKFVHFTDSASGNRPPLQFSTGSQLIRPGLTRLLTAVESGAVTAVVPSSSDALASADALMDRITSFLEEHGLTRRTREGDPSYYFSK